MAGPINGAGIPIPPDIPNTQNHTPTPPEHPEDPKISAIAPTIIADSLPDDELNFDSLNARITVEIDEINMTEQHATQKDQQATEVIEQATHKDQQATEVIGQAIHKNQQANQVLELDRVIQKDTARTQATVNGAEHQVGITQIATADLKEGVVETTKLAESTIQDTAQTDESVTGAEQNEKEINKDSDQVINKAKSAQQNVVTTTLKVDKTEVKVEKTEDKKVEVKVKVQFETHISAAQTSNVILSKEDIKELSRVLETASKNKLESAGALQKEYARLSIRGNYIVYHKLTSKDTLLQKTLNAACEENKHIQNHNDISFKLSIPKKEFIAHIDDTGVGVSKEFQAAHPDMPIYSEEEVENFGADVTLEELQNAGITPSERREITAEQSERFDILLNDYVTAHVTLVVIQRLLIDTANNTQLSQQVPIQQQAQAAVVNGTASREDTGEVTKKKVRAKNIITKDGLLNTAKAANEVRLWALQRKNQRGEGKTVAKEKHEKLVENINKKNEAYDQSVKRDYEVEIKWENLNEEEINQILKPYQIDQKNLPLLINELNRLDLSNLSPQNMFRAIVQDENSNPIIVAQLRGMISSI